MMNRKLIVVVVLTVVAVFAFCTIAGANSYWQRMEKGFSNREQIYEYVYEYRSPELEIDVSLPQLNGAVDSAWQQQFNRKLFDFAEDFAAELKDIARKSRQAGFEFYAPFQGILRYELKLNKGGLLSLVIDAYTYTGGAHGMTTRDYINLDLTTGERVQFLDLFASEAELVRAAEVINAKVTAEPEWFFIQEFAADAFPADQGFYLEPHRAVICFGLYEIAPYVSGIQEFEVPAP